MFQGHPRRLATVRRRPGHGYKAEVQVKDSPGVECWECPNPDKFIQSWDTSPTRHPPCATYFDPHCNAQTRRHCTTNDPRRHRRSWLGTALARDVRAEVQGPRRLPRLVAYGGHPVFAIVAPRCRCSPRGSGVHARPTRAHARMGSIFKTKYPTGHRDQKETGTQSYVREELPGQEGVTLLVPAPNSPYPVGPDVLCPDPSTVP